MQKIVWTCWFQGRDQAPDLVKQCLASWEHQNPGWEVRCLDASTVGLYLDMSAFVDLDRQAMTAASLSDLLRILLLHEYGGVWVDATLFCNQPLDTWLPAALGTGFFAFSAPSAGRLLASWFLACAPNNRLVAKWAAKAVGYWNGRTRSDDYFWFHHQFDALCAVDPEARAAWERVPCIPADGPHSLQAGGLMYRPASTVASQIDWTIPVFKLTHRIERMLTIRDACSIPCCIEVSRRMNRLAARTLERGRPRRTCSVPCGTDSSVRRSRQASRQATTPGRRGSRG